MARTRCASNRSDLGQNRGRLGSEVLLKRSDPDPTKNLCAVSDLGLQFEKWASDPK